MNDLTLTDKDFETPEVLTDKDFEETATLTDADFAPELTDKDFAPSETLTDKDFSLLGTQSNLGTEFVKGLGFGVETGLAQSIGSPMVALGESLRGEAQKNIIAGGKDYGPPRTAEFMTKTGEKFEALGTKIRDFFIKKAGEGFEAPSKEIMTAEFGKTGYGRRLAYSLGSSVPMMAAAMGVTVATDNPFLGASIFGPQAFGSFYDEARKNSVPVDKAIELSIVNAASQVGLETIPLTGWLRKGGGLFKRVIRGALQEGLIEEGSQQFVQNSLEGIGWKGSEVNLTEGMVESVLVGTIMGAGLGVVPNSMTIEDWKYQTKKQMAKQVIAEAKEQGLPQDQAESIVGMVTQQIDKIDNQKIADLSDTIKEEITEDAVKVLDEKIKPKPGPKSLLSWTLKSGRIKTSRLIEHLGKEWKQDLPFSVAKNDGRDPSELYSEAVGDGLIPPMPEGYTGGEAQYFIDQLKASKGKVLETTQAFEDGLAREYELFKQREELTDEVIRDAEKEITPDVEKEVNAATDEGVVEFIEGRWFEETPTEESIKVRHYTLPENVDKILQEGFDTTKPPIHGTGGLEAGAKTEKFGKDILYFTLDDRRWNKAEIYVGEGKGDISRNSYDYENQKWIKENNAYKKVDLKPIEATIKSTAKILDINDYSSYASIRDESGIFDGYNHIESVLEYARKNGYDAVHISNKGNWEHPTGKVTKYGEKNWYKQVTGNGGVDDYFILNKEAITLVQTQPTRLELLPPEVKDLFQGKAKGDLLSKSTEALGTAEPVVSEAQKQEEFKIYEQVDALIHKFATRFGERYTPSGATGVLYPDTGNIFLRGANALFTAIHEVTHYIDIKEGISKAALRTTGVSKAGNPIYDPATKLLRKEMTTFYTSNYPGGRKTHKLEKRMQEGLARFVELYVYKPTFIKENYPYLFRQILQPGGEFYNTTTTDLVRDAREIIGKYQALSPTNKILARQLNKERKVKDSYLSLPEKVYTEIADALFPLEKLAKGAGVEMTTQDPSVWARFSNNGLSTLVVNNIYGMRGYWVMAPNGDFAQKFPFNWKTIVDSVSGETDVFGAWLSARDMKANYEHLQELNLLIEALSGGVANPAFISKEEQQQYDNFVKERNALTRQLQTNGVTREEAEAAYAEHALRFREQEQMYDALVQEDLNLLNHPMVQLLSPELHAEFSKRKGYAPKKRDFFFNEILGEAGEYIGNVKIGKTKVSSMLPRKGSELPELNPLYSSILSHAETMKKAIRQMVYNHIYNLAPSWPAILQIVPLKTAVMPTGEIFFPQDKDPNIMMARANYKRRPVLVAKEVKQVLDATVTYQNVHVIERWMKNFSRLFVKGTTAAYPPFAITNFLVDQITAAAQTQTRIKPIISPIKELILRLDKHGQDALFFKEYLILGGARQTLVKYLDGSPDEVMRNIQQEKNGLEKALDLLNQGIDIFAIPTQYSEILTRAAEYIRAIKAGDSQIVALEKAGQVTAPFHHKGRWGGGSLGVSWVASLPFFNPGIQVLAQYGKTWQSPTTRTRVAFVTALVTGAIIASFEYLRYKGTEEQKEVYKSLSPDELARYLYIPHPNGKSLLRLRMPEQMAMLGTMINMALGNLQMDTKYKPGEFVQGALSWLPEQFDPTNPARMLFSWMPQIALPAIGAATGKKFYPEVRDIEGPSIRYLPEGQRAYPYTSNLAKAIGAKLDLSPAKIDYLIEGYLGRATRMFVGKNIGNPFIRDMYLYSSRQLQDYYDTREKNAVDFKNIDAIQDMKERQKVRNIHEKVKDIDELVSKFRKIDLDKNENDESYMATLRGRILDKVDTLWEVTR